MTARSGSLLLVFVLAASPSEAQEAQFEVLTIPPADVGTCLPPLFSAPASERIRQGNRLVIRSAQPFRSREISTFIDRDGRHAGLSDRSQVTAAIVRSVGVLITGTLSPTGVVSGFRIETSLTVPDSVVQAHDFATIQAIIDKGSGTSSRRQLDSTEQNRVRSMVEFMRQRCP